MSMRIKLAIAATALALASVTPVAAATAADDTVLAIVNGDKILKKDVLSATQQLPVKDAKLEQVYPFVVDQIINEKLLDDATAKSKVEQSEDFKTRLDIIRTQLVRQIYIENALKDKLSDKAVKAEYDKFKKDNKGKQEV